MLYFPHFDEVSKGLHLTAMVWWQDRTLPFKFLPWISSCTVVFHIDVYMLTSLKTGLEA